MAGPLSAATENLLAQLSAGRKPTAHGIVRLEAPDLSDALEQILGNGDLRMRSSLCAGLIDLYRKGRLSWTLGEDGAPRQYVVWLGATRKKLE